MGSGDLQPLALAICWEALLNPKNEKKREAWKYMRVLALEGVCADHSHLNPQYLHDLKRKMSACILKALWNGGDTDDIKNHIRTDDNRTFKRWRERAGLNRESTRNTQASESLFFRYLFPSQVFKHAVRAFIYEKFRSIRTGPRTFESWLKNREEEERKQLTSDIRSLGYQIDEDPAGLNSAHLTCAICYIINKL